jgi:hypothetical protein
LEALGRKKRREMRTTKEESQGNLRVRKEGKGMDKRQGSMRKLGKEEEEGGGEREREGEKEGVEGAAE